MYSLAFFCTFLFVIIFCILAKKWADFEVKNGVRWRRSIRSAAGWRLLLTLLLFFLIVSLFCACLFGFQIWVRLYRCKRLSRVKIFRLEDKRGREMCIYCWLKVLTSAFIIYQIEKHFVSIFPSNLLNQLSNPLKVPLFGGKTSFTFIYTLLYVLILRKRLRCFGYIHAECEYVDEIFDCVNIWKSKVYKRRTRKTFLFCILQIKCTYLLDKCT